MKLFRYKTIALGNFKAKQFTLFESKYLFSIIFYYFKGTGWQDRFHTHAFNALSIKIFGTYVERILTDNKNGIYYENQRTKIFKYFPKSTYHMLGVSKGCLTILLSGPWEKTWFENKDGRETELQWNRIRKTTKK